MEVFAVKTPLLLRLRSPAFPLSRGGSSDTALHTSHRWLRPGTEFKSEPGSLAGSGRALSASSRRIPGRACLLPRISVLGLLGIDP